MEPIPLNVAQKQFVNEMLSDPSRNQTAAYMRAYPESTYAAAASSAHHLMKDPRIIAYLERQERDLRDSAHLTAGQVLSHIAEVANADSRDLCDYRRGACRYCHGHEHLYQRRPQEYRDAVAEYLSKHRDDPMGVFFPMLGGLGFNQNKPPHPDCPECDGRGVGYTYVKDLRDIPKSAARLIRSIKETKDGFEIKTRDQVKMVDLATKHLGLTGRHGEGDELETPPAASVTYEAEDGKR